MYSYTHVLMYSSHIHTLADIHNNNAMAFSAFNDAIEVNAHTPNTHTHKQVHTVYEIRIHRIKTLIGQLQSFAEIHKLQWSIPMQQIQSFTMSLCDPSLPIIQKSSISTSFSLSLFPFEALIPLLVPCGVSNILKQLTVQLISPITNLDEPFRLPTPRRRVHTHTPHTQHIHTHSQTAQQQSHIHAIETIISSPFDAAIALTPLPIRVIASIHCAFSICDIRVCVCLPDQSKHYYSPPLSHFMSEGLLSYKLSTIIYIPSRCTVGWKGM